MEYEKLSTNQQINMLEQRLAQYEQEHFNHSINLKLLADSGDTSPEGETAKQAAEEAMKVLDQAHANTKTELQSLKDS